MKNHTLMQTIARANRRAPGKAAGVVVDYVGVFRDLQKALAIYAAPRDGDIGTPIKDKSELLGLLRIAYGTLPFSATPTDPSAILSRHGVVGLQLQRSVKFCECLSVSALSPIEKYSPGKMRFRQVWSKGQGMVDKRPHLLELAARQARNEPMPI